MRYYRVIVNDRVFNEYIQIEEAISIAKILFNTGYNDIWISYRNGKKVPNTPHYIKSEV